MCDDICVIITIFPCMYSYANSLYLLGTTVQVRNLFKQVPVRRQIITNAKKINQSIKLLETLMQCFGICKPNVRIQLRVNNSVTFSKPSLNNLKEAVNHVLGRRIMSNMEWVELKNAEVGIFLKLFKKLLVYN